MHAIIASVRSSVSRPRSACGNAARAASARYAAKELQVGRSDIRYDGGALLESPLMNRKLSRRKQACCGGARETRRGAKFFLPRSIIAAITNRYEADGSF